MEFICLPTGNYACSSPTQRCCCLNFWPAFSGMGARHPLMSDYYPSSLTVLPAQLLCHLHQCCRLQVVTVFVCCYAMTCFLCSPSSFPRLTRMDTHHFCMLWSTDPSGMYLPGAAYQQRKLWASPQPWWNCEHRDFILAALSVVIHKHFTIRKPRLECTDTRALLSPPGDVGAMITGSSFLF